MPARTGSWLARNGQLPARIEFYPHEPENGRTKRFIAARNWNCSAQIDFDAVARDLTLLQTGNRCFHFRKVDVGIAIVIWRPEFSRL
jgi:hypothetical protein